MKQPWSRWWLRQRARSVPSPCVQLLNTFFAIPFMSSFMKHHLHAWFSPVMWLTSVCLDLCICMYVCLTYRQMKVNLWQPLNLKNNWVSQQPYHRPTSLVPLRSWLWEKMQNSYIYATRPPVRRLKKCQVFNGNAKFFSASVQEIIGLEVLCSGRQKKQPTRHLW